MEIINFDKTNLIYEVKEVFSSWTNENAELRTVAYLSRETGVSDSSIRRLVNSDIKILDDSLFKLLTYISGVYEYQAFLDYFSDKSEISNWFTINYSYMKKSLALQEYRFCTSTNEVAASAMAYSVYNVILVLGHVSFSFIRDQFGMRGEIELENLIAKGFLLADANGVVVKEDKLLKFTKEQVASLLPDISKTFFKVDHDFNARSMEVGAVSKNGYTAIMNTYQKFLGEVAEIYKESPGNIPVIVAGFFDSLTTQPYFEGGKNETHN
jgi:hypothetical protein